MWKSAIALVAICTFTSGAAVAGGMAEPLMEPEVLVEEASPSSGGIVIPLLLLAILAAVASGSSSSAGPTF